MKKEHTVFLCSVYFVLGFSVLFALLGVLLQTIFSGVSGMVTKWISYVGGVLIIFFGLYLLKVFKFTFLQKEYKIHPKVKFKSKYLTSFVFGAAFAAGWTPCVGAILGAIFALAITKPSMGFVLLLTYAIGLGLPFLVVGYFTDRAQRFIKKSGKWITYANYVFGVLLIGIGILVFMQRLDVIAKYSVIGGILEGIGEGFAIEGSVHIGIAFVGGLLSFLSPCVLPLIPAYLTYLASTVTKQ